MSPRYALVVANPTAEAEPFLDIQWPNGLTRTYEASGLILLSSPSTCLARVAPAQGIVIGKLYHHHGATRILQRVDDNVAVALGTGTVSPLIEQHWGSYVAAVRDGDGFLILRDPSATMPCYFVRAGRYMIFASDISILLVMTGLRPKIDWTGALRSLLFGGLPTVQTALEEIQELLPGTMVRTAGGAASSPIPIWSPWRFVGSRQGVSLQDNIETLRRKVESCVSISSKAFSKPIISVSGGLDSSIVAACSSDRQSLTAVTFYTDDLAGDERGYAKILCDALKIELITVRYDTADIDIDMPCSPHLPRPIGRTQATAYEKALLTLLRDIDGDGFLTGNGGDNVFFNSRSARAVVDRFLAEGLGMGVLETLGDVSAVTGASYWQVGRAALRMVRNRRKPYAWQPTSRFLHPDFVQDAVHARPAHAWLDAPLGTLPGHYASVAGLLRVHQTLEPLRSQFAQVVSPLLSQPIVELCLSIPSWQWFAGGRDRSVARSAFTGMLPDAVIARRGKGTPDGFSARIIDRFRDGIRERLLDGNLVAQGLIDRPLLETVLNEPVLRRPEDRPRILDLLDTEAWLKHWSGYGETPSRLDRDATKHT